MNPLKIATAQFENRSGDKAFNLGRIRALAGQARALGAQAVAFHECSVTGYTFARELTEDQLWDVAEPVPDGPSVRELTDIAREQEIPVLAGLFERGDDRKIYKAYVCVNGDGLVAKYRKIHPFIHPSIQPGTEYVVFDLCGWKCGILICYDNNVPENVRATRLLGAQVIFMPHVTMCTPSTRPGAGFVDPALWERRHADPTSLREQFDSLKGRQWLMKWLPARAYDNAIYAVFSNPIGMDHDQLKNGCSMIVDPYGDIVAECRELGDQVVVATLQPEALERAGGARYLAARKPELYAHILGQPNASRQAVSWLSGPA
ncbi:MAG TPA: nitrilase family protein [Terrimicrobiaceae bacterium]|nr:nitrilase family protein [Terrimicrobiaceae bacterium]